MGLHWGPPILGKYHLGHYESTPPTCSLQFEVAFVSALRDERSKAVGNQVHLREWVEVQFSSPAFLKEVDPASCSVFFLV